MPDYNALYELFRQYRNCIHPQAQIQKSLSIELGQAQMALGLLNATILNLDQNVFVGKQIFEKVSGSPQYDSRGVLHLQLDRTPHHSFVVLRKPVSDNISLKFDLHLTPNSLFNFVFNYVNEGDFKMIRLDMTNLNNRGMPFIRYSIGDEGSWGAEGKCSCGRSSPRLKAVEGRIVDQFVTRDGRASWA